MFAAVRVKQTFTFRSVTFGEPTLHKKVQLSTKNGRTV